MSLVIGAASEPAHAGVWVNEPGHGYAQATVGHQRASKMFLADSSLVPQFDEALLGQLAPLFESGRYSASDLSLYGEYGIAEHLELVGSVPLRFVTNRWDLAGGPLRDIVHENFGLGDIETGLRYGSVVSGVALSALASLRGPLYNNAPFALNMQAGNSDFEDDRVPLGQGTYDASLSGGVGVGSRYAWGLAEAGARARNRSFSVVLPVRVQGGVKPVDGLALFGGVDLAWSLGNGRAPDFFRDRWGKGPIAIDNQRYLTGSLGVAVDLVEGFGATVGVGQTLWAQRFPRLTSVNVGATWRFSTAAAESSP